MSINGSNIIESLLLIWIQYSGLIALIFIILFTVAYITNKKVDSKSTKTKRYKILLILAIIIIILIQDIFGYI